MIERIKEIVYSIRLWTGEHLRTLCRRIPPGKRPVVVFIMLGFFSAGTVYTTVSAILSLGKANGEDYRIEHIKQWEWKPDLQQQTDSINLLKLQNDGYGE